MAKTTAKLGKTIKSARPKPKVILSKGSGKPHGAKSAASAKGKSSNSSKSAKSSMPTKSVGSAKAIKPRAAKPAKASASAKASPAKSAPAAKGSSSTKPASSAAAPSKQAAPQTKASKSPAGPPASPEFSVSGQIYQKGKLVPGVLHIDTASGTILRISKSTTLPNHIDFGNRAILPGAIDVHVHFRDPGYTHKEDLFTGSVSAAFGGVTSFVDMPNTLPATISTRAVKEKVALAMKQCVIDYGFWSGGTWYTGDLPQMLKWTVGVKTYLGSSTGDLLLEDVERFKDVLAAAGAANRPVMLHCESQRVLQNLRRTEGTLEDHDLARPPLAEVEAIYDAMKAMAATKKPPVVHVAHVASPEAVQAAVAAKFSIGVCPHHLLLDTTASLSHAYGKMNPPLRSPASRKALWDLFAAGKIQILESDHAPHTQAEKEDSFHAAPSGVPGVETMAPLMLHLAASGKLDLRLVVEALTSNPAKLLGLTDRGELAPGMKADFAVYDLKKPVKIAGDKLHSKCGWTPFEGEKAVFPTHTYVRGRAVVADGQLVAQAGSGQPLLPFPKE